MAKANRYRADAQGLKRSPSGLGPETQSTKGEKMNKFTGVIAIISFIVLASECEFTLANLIIKAIALAVIVVATLVSSREEVPARRRTQWISR
jgi:hypothetical protein